MERLVESEEDCFDRVGKNHGGRILPKSGARRWRLPAKRPMEDETYVIIDLAFSP
jgi:hypothetical protein